MGVFLWLGEHWFDAFQTIGVIGGLVFTAYSVRRDESARQISNLIALNDRHDQIWRTFYTVPALSRILRPTVDLSERPISDEEHLFVKMLILHLDTVRRAAQKGMLIEISGIQNDVRSFLSLPIPRIVWEKIKGFQDAGFVDFVEACLESQKPTRLQESTPSRSAI